MGERPGHGLRLTAFPASLSRLVDGHRPRSWTGAVGIEHPC